MANEILFYNTARNHYEDPSLLAEEELGELSLPDLKGSKNGKLPRSPTAKLLKKSLSREERKASESPEALRNRSSIQPIH